MEKITFFNYFSELGIDNDTLLDIAYNSGLIERKRAIHPSDLLFALCLESTSGTVSHNDVAAQLESRTDISVSRVAIWKKMNSCCVDFFKAVLEVMILKKFTNDAHYSGNLSPNFNRVIVQDSTIIRLPKRLFDIFSGVANAHSKVCNARIQGVYDILNERFISFTIDAYSKNDLETAPELLVEKGDLSLRDRGYLVLEEVERHTRIGADCIYRYKNKMTLLNYATEKPLDILALLEKKTTVDTEVKLNNTERTTVRLIAFPVSEELANNRRMKAKKENKTTPNTEYLKLLGWSIYITTLSREKADTKSIFGFYKLRWRIETIFKSWKSNMGFDKVHNVSQDQLSVIIMARFIMIIICAQYIFKPCRALIKKTLNKDLSLMKITHYLIKHPMKLIQITADLSDYPQEVSKTMEIMAKYCSYDKRKRSNYQQDLEMVML